MSRSYHKNDKVNNHPPRQVLESLDIPDVCNNITYTLKQSSRAESAYSQSQLSVASSQCTPQQFCTKHSCQDSQICIKTFPNICPHGLKDTDSNECECSGTNHDNASEVSISNSNLEYNTKSRHSRTGESCQAAIPIIPLKQCCSFKPECMIPTAPPIEKRTSIAAGSEYRAPNGQTCATPAPNVGSSTPDLKKGKSTSDLQECCGKMQAICFPPRDNRMECCADPVPPNSITDSRKKANLRTSFLLPEDQERLVEKSAIKKSSMKEDSKIKKDSCSCTEVTRLPGQKKCSCHFPPAFKQFGCTGNIAGNCNCNDD